MRIDKDNKVYFVDSILSPEKCLTIENYFDKGEYLILVENYFNFDYQLDNFIHCFSSQEVDLK